MRWAEALSDPNGDGWNLGTMITELNADFFYMQKKDDCHKICILFYFAQPTCFFLIAWENW